MEIEKIKVLNLELNDVLLVEVRDDLPHEAIFNIERGLKSLLPNNEFRIYSGNDILNITVLREKEGLK